LESWLTRSRGGSFPGGPGHRSEGLEAAARRLLVPRTPPLPLGLPEQQPPRRPQRQPGVPCLLPPPRFPSWLLSSWPLALWLCGLALAVVRWRRRRPIALAHQGPVDQPCPIQSNRGGLSALPGRPPQNRCTTMMGRAAARHAQRAPLRRSRPNGVRIGFSLAAIPFSTPFPTTAPSCPAHTHAPPTLGPRWPGPAGSHRWHRDRPDRPLFLL
jgi:hypothetical protein